MNPGQPLMPSRTQSPFTDGSQSPFSQPCPPQAYRYHPAYPRGFQPLQPASRPHSPYVNRHSLLQPQPLYASRPQHMPLGPVPPGAIPAGPSTTQMVHREHYSLLPSMNRNGPLEVPTEPNISLLPQQLNTFGSHRESFYQKESGMFSC